MTLKEKCRYCGKLAEITSEKMITALGVWQQTYSCGHTVVSGKPILPTLREEESFSSLDGSKNAFPFQKEAVKFVEGTNFNALIADAVGAGKTIELCLALKRSYKDLTPILILQKSATTYQWITEYHSWCSDDLVFQLTGSKSIVPPGMNVYISSHDLLSRKGVPELLAKLGIKTLVVDECHAFKDPSAKRTVGLIQFIKLSGVKHKIFLSGTPVMNRADEYFTVLNLLAPQYFPSKKHFQTRWLTLDDTGRYSRIAFGRREQFKELTGRWIIRRERKELQRELPPFQRNFIYREIADTDMRNAYNQELDLFEDYLRGRQGRPTIIETLGKLAKIRRLTAMAKINETLEFSREFLDNIDEDKLCIGIHHEGVRSALYYGLQSYGALQLSGQDSPEQKGRTQDLFNKNPQYRVLVANMLASGTGLNLQEACSNAIVMERQWNFVTEKQFEGRFYREGQKNPVTVDYLLAAGTIDQYFTEMVERKRKIFRDTMMDSENNRDCEDDYQFSNDEDGIQSLAETIVRHRL